MRKILITIISSIIATIVFGIVIYLLDKTLTYAEIAVFFVVYAVIFYLTTKYLNENRK